VAQQFAGQAVGQLEHSHPGGQHQQPEDWISLPDGDHGDDRGPEQQRAQPRRMMQKGVIDVDTSEFEAQHRHELYVVVGSGGTALPLVAGRRRGRRPDVHRLVVRQARACAAGDQDGAVS
jgi:hypothetical protein